MSFWQTLLHIFFLVLGVFAGMGAGSADVKTFVSKFSHCGSLSQMVGF